MDYGFGAVFGCPAHDQRDLDFANKYKLEVITVVEPIDNINKDFLIHGQAYSGPGKMINSKFLNELKVPEESVNKAIQYLEKNNIGKKKTM